MTSIIRQLSCPHRTILWTTKRWADPDRPLRDLHERGDPPYRGPRQPVRREQVEIVKEFLNQCRPTCWARKLISPVSSDLKHWVENWAGSYISTGAAIVAALELGMVCVVTGEGSRNVLIGVHFDDVSARMAERGWYIARDHVTATRIEQPKPQPEIDPSFWAKWAKENGIEIDCDLEPDPQPDADDGAVAHCATGYTGMDTETPPTFWEDIAEALGLSEVGEG